MSQPEIKRSSILGRTLTNLFQTRWVPYFHIEGLHKAVCCDVVMEFGADLLVLNSDSISFWSDGEPLQPLVLSEHCMEASTTPVGSSVLAVGVDQLGDLYILFHNGVFLSLEISYSIYLRLGDTSDLQTTRCGDPLVLFDWWSRQPL
jgi:hypothetical protein